MNYTLLPCTYNDLDFIFELKILCMKWYIEKIYGWNDDVQRQKTFNELKRNIDNMKLIIVDNKKIGITTFIEENNNYRVGILMIHPEYQNGGLGTAIITDYIMKSKQESKRIVIKTYKENPAKNLYKRLGFKPYKLDETHMHLEIDFGKENKMSKEPIIETERLILRPITLDDAEACFSWNSDERVTKFMSYPTLTDISQTIDWIKSTLVDEKEWNWAFVLKSENKVIGTGGIGPSDKMLGYWGMGYNLHYDYWHKGYCTEAMKAIIDFVYRELGVKKICSDHAVGNPRSGKVMEKCGLKFDHYGEYTKNDGSQTFKAKYYKMELE